MVPNKFKRYRLNLDRHSIELFQQNLRLLLQITWRVSVKINSRDRADFLAAWKEFRSRFGTEKKSIKHVIKSLHPDGRIVCSSCKHENRIGKNCHERAIVCKYCGQQIWLTAGTFFHKVKKVRPLLAAMWFMGAGVAFTASDLHNLLKIPSSTAWSIVQKLFSMITDQIGSNALAIPSGLFLDVVSRRTRVTPAHAHPRREEDEAMKALINERHQTSGAVAMISPIMANAELSGLDKELYECLSTEPIQFEALQRRSGLAAVELLGTLSMLEMAGVVRALPGNRYVRCPDNILVGPQDESLCMRVVSIIEHLKRTHRGISRKYLQNYLAGYWCTIDRTTWHFGSVFQLCLKSKPKNRAIILKYVSPTLVKVAD